MVKAPQQDRRKHHSKFDSAHFCAFAFLFRRAYAITLGA